MESRVRRVVSMVAVAGLGLVLRAEAPAGRLVQLDGMPSFHQRDGQFVAGGKAYCGPTAASNALMWLGEHGYPKLLPQADTPSAAQRAMIQNLAARMGTYGDGTPLESFRCGINTYIRSAGYVPGAWNSSGASLRAFPDVRLLSGIDNHRTVAWLGLGRYAYDPARDTYERRSGHLVTLVGYRTDAAEEAGSFSVVISDPEHPGGFRTLELRRLDKGLLSCGSNRVGAGGYWQLEDPSAGAELPVTILESIQSLSLGPGQD